MVDKRFYFWRGLGRLGKYAALALVSTLTAVVVGYLSNDFSFMYFQNQKIPVETLDHGWNLFGLAVVGLIQIVISVLIGCSLWLVALGIFHLVLWLGGYPYEENYRQRRQARIDAAAHENGPVISSAPIKDGQLEEPL